MKVGILETGEVADPLRSVYGDYPVMFRRLLGAVDPELEFQTWRAVAGDLPEAPEAADAWLVTGSRHGVYDDLPWIAPLEAFLRAALAAGVPVVGVCFGHQILARALGGRAEKSEHGWVLGVQDYTLAARPSWMADAPERFAVRAIHQDQVTALPPDAMVLARSEACPYAALAYGDPERPDAISIQPHPEFTASFLDALFTLRAGRGLPQAETEAARATLERPVASADWARWIVAYLRRHGGARSAA